MCNDLRSEEHTSELQSLTNLVCRLLLEKKRTACLAWCRAVSAYMSRVAASVASPGCIAMPILFFFNDTAPTEIYPLSLPDALPICFAAGESRADANLRPPGAPAVAGCERDRRSEEHTSELQSLTNLVCRLLLE